MTKKLTLVKVGVLKKSYIICVLPCAEILMKRTLLLFYNKLEQKKSF